MAVIKITNFGGEVPSLSARSLPADKARISYNLYPGVQEFRPLRENKQVATGLAVGNPQSLYRLERKADGTLNEDPTTGWLTYAARRSFAKGQINDNLTGRTYYSFNDGVTAPRVMDASGVDKLLGISPPGKPVVVVNGVDEFTPEDRAISIDATKLQTVAAIRASAVSSFIGGVTGIPAGTTTSAVTGYLDAMWDGPKQVRTYRMGSTGGANNGTLTNAYSTAALSSFDWIKDPSLGGFWATTDGTSPIWQGGAGLDHWCLTFPAFATVYSFNPVTLRAQLAAVLRPGETTSVPMFTNAQLDGADGLVARLVNYTSQSNANIAPTIASFKGELQQLKLMLDQGSSASLAADRSAFYAQTAIASEINAGFNNFAAAINTAAKAFTLEATGGTSYTDVQIKTIALAHWAPNERGIYALNLSGLESAMRALFAGVATGMISVQANANAYDPRPLINTLDASVGEGHFSSYPGFNTASGNEQIAAAVVAKKARIESLARVINQYYAWMQDEIGAGTLLNAVSTFYAEKLVADNVVPGVVRIVESRFYVMTWVTSWGEESAPSPVSTLVELDSNDTCTITIPAIPVNQGVVGWRLYRSNTGSQTTEFQAVAFTSLPGTTNITPTGTPTQVVNTVYLEIGRTGAAAPSASEVAYWVDRQLRTDETNQQLRNAMLLAAITFEGDPIYGTNAALAKALLGTGSLPGAAGISINNPSVVDNLKGESLGEVLPTTTWLPPPPDLQGLVGMANGIMAGFFGNTVCLTEAYIPYAWPVEYQAVVDYPVVALAAFGTTLFVGTRGSVHLISGSDPASMSAQVVPGAQVCVSARSVASSEQGVVFASAEGICVADSNGVRVVTSGLFTRDDWQAINPATIVGVMHDGAYYFQFSRTPVLVNGTRESIVRAVYTEIGRVGSLAPTSIEVNYWVTESTTKSWNNFKTRQVMLTSAATYANDPIYSTQAAAATALLGLSSSVVVNQVYTDIGRTNQTAAEVAYWVNAQASNGWTNEVLRLTMLQAAASFVDNPIYQHNADLAVTLLQQMTQSGCYALDTTTGKLTQVDMNGSAFFTDLVTDTLYIANGTTVQAVFTGDSYRRSVYRTGVIKLPKTTHLAWLQVDSDFSSPVVVKWMGDGGVIRHTAILTNNLPVRLPVGIYQEHEVEVLSLARVTGVTLTSTTQELQNV